MTMTGSLRQDATTVVGINGNLRCHVTTIPKSAVSDSIFAFGTVRALEIETVDAVPHGRRIGQILSWHLARLASAQGIGYVTAGNVTAALARFKRRWVSSISRMRPRGRCSSDARPTSSSRWQGGGAS